MIINCVIYLFLGYIKLNETREKGKCQKSEDTIITDLLSAFHVFDIQKKGYIESRDLREALGLTETDIPSKELQQMFKEIGLLSDRKITFAGNALIETVDSYPRMIHDLDFTKALGGGGVIPYEKVGGVRRLA